MRARAVFLDAGGVIVLPHRGLVAGALRQAGLAVDPDAIPRAHYRAVRRLDLADQRVDSSASDYLPAFCDALGVPGRAVAVLAQLFDRARSGEIMWREPAPAARETIDRLTDAGIPVVVVTNSDGHGEQNLRDAGICQTGPGRGATVLAVIDSTVVGAAKPDPRIFELALARAGAERSQVVHVGDRVVTDVDGARAAGIAPIHLDPYRLCRASDHRHVRTLAGLWRHL